MRWAIGLSVAGVLTLMGTPSFAAKLDSVIRIAMQSTDEAAASQKKIDKSWRFHKGESGGGAASLC